MKAQWGGGWGKISGHKNNYGEEGDILLAQVNQQTWFWQGLKKKFGNRLFPPQEFGKKKLKCFQMAQNMFYI